MVEFKPKFAANDVDNLLRFYWSSQSERQGKIERSLESRALGIRQKQFLTRDEFRLACSWTAVRAKQHYQSNPETVVRETTARAFKADDERERIDTLIELEGVAYPVASTILHFFHPATYPILTYPSLWSLNVENPPLESFEFWMDYTRYFRNLVNEWNVTARDLDRAFWQYHYDTTAPRDTTRSPYADLD